MIEHYKFLHGIAGDAVAKFAIPSPNMLFFRADFEEGIYENDEAIIDDLVAAYRGVIQALYDEGCRYLQLDDTSWAAFFSEKGRNSLIEKGRNPEKTAELCARAINESIANRPGDMLVTMHICRGISNLPICQAAVTKRCQKRFLAVYRWMVFSWSLMMTARADLNPCVM